jgi:signal transduction histidine kinase
MFDENNTITGYSSIRHDITDEKQVELLHSSLKAKSDELIDLNRGLEERIAEGIIRSQQKDHMMAQQSKLASMGEMIGNIAHQWRQPLNALSLLLQKQQLFFDRGLLTAEKLEESVSKGTALINKMSSTIDDFRDFFKPNKEKDDFDVKEAVETTLELIDATLHNENIQLAVEIQDGLIVHGYKNEFSQVILNLINNAKDILVEKKKNEGKIKLRTSFSDNGRTLNLHVCDNGGGVPESVLDQVFEPYFTTKEEGKGTGIGLYMSKMIIEENMGGKISVKNSDEGAVFTISIALKKG